ncbi:MAG: class I SAM-dependent methyltransferase [Bacteroidetes bacterium]|nr:class I SAM-dependent methyltransferase [Bacteroidota bacterium]
MDKLFAVGNYLKYRIKSGTAHDVHSPFVFDLLNNVIHDQAQFYWYGPLESLRSKLLLDQRTIQVSDFGAVSTGKKVTKKISTIAKNSLQEKKYAQLIFRLVNFSNAKNILELGTSLGLTTLYIANAAKKSRIITMEGCPEIAKIAIENFDKMKCKNIELVIGNFNETLPKTLSSIEQVDLVYFDGNHRKQATLDYFKLCLTKKTADSVFIFDDIYWSREMKAAWDEIIRNENVTVSIDLFKLGIVFFRSGIPKQHFRLKF